MVVEVKSRLRKWGNSLGIVVPQKLLEGKRFSEGDEITIIIQTENPEIQNVFGSLKNWKIDPQKIKDEIRAEESR